MAKKSRKQKQYAVVVPFSEGYRLRGGIFQSLKKAQQFAENWAEPVVVSVVPGSYPFHSRIFNFDRSV